MKNFMRIVIPIVCCFMLLCFGLASCGKAPQENQKYDVTIKIKNNYGSEWVFTPDVSELTYEFEYTGDEMNFYVDTYNLADHPRWSDKWLSPSGEGADIFHQTMTYRPPEGKNKSFTGPVKERGEYCICVSAGPSSDLWNFRSVYLYVQVK